MSHRPAEPGGRRERAPGVRAPVADEQLVRALYEEHAGPLLAYVLRLVGGDRHRAEDVVQETLLRAWRHPASLDPDKGSARPWLWTVARHLVVDSERARRARPAGGGRERVGRRARERRRRPGPGGPGGGRRSLDADQRAPQRPARDLLPGLFGRGSRCGALGVPAGTVKSRTYYALRALRLALEERGVTGRRWRHDRLRRNPALSGCAGCSDAGPDEEFEDPRACGRLPGLCGRGRRTELDGRPLAMAGSHGHEAEATRRPESPRTAPDRSSWTACWGGPAQRRRDRRRRWALALAAAAAAAVVAGCRLRGVLGRRAGSTARRWRPPLRRRCRAAEAGRPRPRPLAPRMGYRRARRRGRCPWRVPVQPGRCRA